MLEAPLFTLSDLLKYRNGEYSPLADIEKIECPHTAQMVRQMIQLDPSQRPLISTFLDGHHSGEGRAFPSYFHDFAHTYISDIIATSSDNISSPLYAHLPTIDARIERLYGDFDKIQTFLQLSPDTKRQLDDTTFEEYYTTCLPNISPLIHRESVCHAGNNFVRAENLSVCSSLLQKTLVR